jgi:hypothetical protein
MDKLGSMFEKLKYALSLLDSNEFLFFLILLAAYHFILLLVLFVSARGSAMLKVKTLASELEELKKSDQLRDAAWKDREEELHRVMHIEKEREISQIRAEYDSYIGLLEQKLMRSKTKQV